MKLADYIAPFADEISFWWMAFDDPQYPIHQLGELSLDLSEKLRAVAIMVLLVKANTDGFYHNLIRSGISRKNYLQRLKQAGISQDHNQASGRTGPLLDAIAAGEFNLAQQIKSLSPTDWMEGHEYLDDYCYAQILFQLIEKDVNVEPVQLIISRFSEYLSDESSARLDVCQALLDKNRAAFDDAFNELLEEQETLIAENIERGEMEEPEVLAEREVFVEGLALLRIAARRGLSTESEYRYCPSLARLPMQTPFVDL